ncbi:recombinase RecT [Peptoniphilus sp.]|jgi:recombination protein RecT|uniref:recombinase RecT n=1 Tax=Peptoniphilus sp. TaxID=1971214 RepID=UPI003D91A4AD
MTNEIARKPVNEMKNILNIPSIRTLFDNALSDNSGAFVSSLIDLYGGDSYLQECDPKDVVMEALKAATLKLPINKNLGFGYVVPFKNKQGKLVPNFIIGYKGLIQLAMRTGQYKSINSGIIYEGMEVSEDVLRGTLSITGKKTSNKVKGYFAYFELINGFEKSLYMTYDEAADWGKKYSKSFNKGPWNTEFDSQAQKTCLRRLLSKYGVLSTEMQTLEKAEEDGSIAIEAIDNNAVEELETTIIDQETGEVIETENIVAPF